MAWFRRNWWAVIFLLFYAFLTVINFQVDVGEYGYTDDFYYAKATRETSLPAWVVQRYESWSGRTSADTIIYLLFSSDFGLTAWRLLNPLFFLLLFYSMARLSIGRGNRNTIIFFLTIAFTAVGLMASVVLIETSYWITGSINYLWPTALALFSLVPLWDHVVFGQETKLGIFHITAGVIAVNGEEQLALVIPCLALTLIVLWFIQKRKFKRSFILYLLALIISSLFLLLAPGSVSRSSASVKMFFPGFNEFSLLVKVLLGIQYTFVSILSFNKLFLITLWIIALVYLWIRNKEEKFISGIAFSLVFAVIILLMSFDPTINEKISSWLFNFNNLVHYDKEAASVFFRFDIAFAQTILSMAFWGFMLLFVTPLSIYLVQKNKPAEVIPYLSLYFGGVASLLVMAFSPTIYESGYRPRYLFMILFIILLLAVIKRTFYNIQNTNRIASAAFIFVPLILFAPYMLIFREYALANSVTLAGFTENGQAHCKIDELQKGDNLIRVSGWMYVKGQDPRQEDKYIIFRSPVILKGFSAKAYARYDVNALVNDGKSYERAGVKSNININDLAQGRYQVGLGVYDKTTRASYACYLDEYVDIGSK